MSGVASLLKRIVSSTLLLGLTGFILFKAGAFWFGLEVIAFIALALFEFFYLLRKENHPVYRLFGITMGVAIPFIVLLESGNTQSGEVLFLVLGCLFLFLIQFFKQNNAEALVGISLTLFGILYISWFLSFLIKIRFLNGGVAWIAYLLAVTKAADIGAYAFGSSLGRHSLIQHISPKKTVEGLLGGLALSVLVSLALGPYLPKAFSPVHLAAMGFLVGVVGQIGDLSESLMKRFCNAKDSAEYLPGIGGVLDSVDSIIFTAPIFYFHIRVLS